MDTYLILFVLFIVVLGIVGSGIFSHSNDKTSKNNQKHFVLLQQIRVVIPA